MNGNYDAFQFIYTVLAGLFGLVSAAIGFMVRTKVVQDGHEKRLSQLEAKMTEFEKAFTEHRIEMHDSLSNIRKDLAVSLQILRNLESKIDDFGPSARCRATTQLGPELGPQFGPQLGSDQNDGGKDL